MDAFLTNQNYSLPAFINLIYPIGSIYLSVNSTSPQQLFGGEWEQIKDKFLLSAGNAYSGGSEGGEAEHILTIDEMPSHNHNLYKNGTDGESVLSIGQDGTYANANYAALGTSVKPFAEATVGISTTDGNIAHNNLPPYLAVYMWIRTS